MNKIHVGIIGAGRIGKVHAVNIIQNIPQMSIKAVTDPNLDINWAKAQNIPIFGKDHHIILNDSEIEAVLICAPAPLHVPLIIEAAEAGKHIFCEKPIALDVKLIENAINAVEKAKVKFQIGFNRRFDQNFAKVKQTVIEGKIGKPHLISISSRDPLPPPIEYVKQSGGLFLDMSIHDFDMARFLMESEVEEVYAAGNVLIDSNIGKAGDIDTAAINLKFKNGALGTIDNSRQAVYGYDQRVEVFGSKGSITAYNNKPTNTVLSNANGVFSDKPLYFFLERYKDSFVAEIQAFCSSIINNEPTKVSGKDGLMPVIIGLAAQRSLNENRPVKIEI